jgi:hypothetical protein
VTLRWKKKRKKKEEKDENKKNKKTRGMKHNIIILVIEGEEKE